VPEVDGFSGTQLADFTPNPAPISLIAFNASRWRIVLQCGLQIEGAPNSMIL
jgi:hypothetical protein